MRDIIPCYVVPPLVGLFAFLQARSVSRVYRQCQSWNEAKGTILSSRVIGWGRGKSAEVLYEFFIPDRVLGGNICPPGCQASNASAYLKRYPQGQAVTVYYDPDSHQSYLELPKKRTIALWGFLGAVGTAFPLLYLAWLEMLK